MKTLRVISTVLLGLFGTGAIWAQSGKGVDKLYVLDCGWSHNADESRWTPGVNVGKPIDMSENCYLIHDSQGYFLWDTGYSDKVADMPDGQVSGGGATVVRRSKTLAAQLSAIGVSPSDIKYVGISHTHPDHTGNVELFPQATLMIQKAEYEAAMSAKSPAIAATHPVMKLEGDKDVFGDGSVTIISTPGHTVGHQSLLVHLPKTGWVILTGDAVHLKDNWDNRRVPAMNVDKEKTVASMQRLADLMAEHHAQLWINHDKVQSDQQKHAPEYYD
ncbi:MAG TPA: N-acyl homoserine lactonase family protein [Bryobacteraceae bacterium]|nr:N-acyl homoserine lactonase family protein [Bryobacteraceae bacterium]